MEEILKYYQELHDSLGTENLCEAFSKKVFQIIQALINKIPKNARVGIRGLGEHTSWLIEMIQMNHINIVGIFDRAKSCDTFHGIPCFSVEQLQDFSLDYIIISNYFHLDEIREELSKSESNIIDFYAELEKQGIRLRGPFYMYSPESPLTLSYFYWNYENRKCDETLQKYLQAALEQKNFVMIDKAYWENGSANSKYPVLIKTWNKVQNLLQLIRCKLQERSQKDIFLFWTDAIAYDELMYMPETQKRGMETGCFFLRAYTTTPYTESTLKAMFRGILPIDDYPAMEEDINESNSSLIQILKNYGYDISCFLNVDTNIIQADYKMDELYNSNTVIWWHALVHVLQQESPCFCLLHFIAESHTPVMYPAQTQVYTDLTHQGYSSAKKQRILSLQYLDKCLSQYEWLLGKKTKIFLSDHGSFVNDEPAWSEARIHAYCFAEGENIPKKKISNIFSYKKFAALVQWIINPSETDFPALDGDEAFFQDTDFYSPVGIHQHIARGTPKQGLAYRGVLTDSYKYVLNALGEEFFYAVQGKQYVREHLQDEELRRTLQQKCGMNFLDIRKIERFKYSQELYRAIHQMEPESNQPLWLTEGP